MTTKTTRCTRNAATHQTTAGSPLAFAAPVNSERQPTIVRNEDRDSMDAIVPEFGALLPESEAAEG